MAHINEIQSKFKFQMNKLLKYSKMNWVYIRISNELLLLFLLWKLAQLEDTAYGPHFNIFFAPNKWINIYYHRKVIAKNLSFQEKYVDGSCDGAVDWKEKKNSLVLKIVFSPKNVFLCIFKYYLTYTAPINPNYWNYCRVFIINSTFLFGI